MSSVSESMVGEVKLNWRGPWVVVFLLYKLSCRLGFGVGPELKLRAPRNGDTRTGIINYTASSLIHADGHMDTSKINGSFSLSFCPLSFIFLLDSVMLYTSFIPDDIAMSVTSVMSPLFLSVAVAQWLQVPSSKHWISRMSPNKHC